MKSSSFASMRCCDKSLAAHISTNMLRVSHHAAPSLKTKLSISNIVHGMKQC